MKSLRTSALTIACMMGLAIGTAAADDDDWGWMPHGYYGHMGMMGPGYGAAIGHGPGWMMGYGPGHMMGYGPGHMMGYGHGWMMGPGRGWMWGGAGMDPDRLSDELLDRIGERIAERHQAMQQIASETDPAARRELVREHLKKRWSNRGRFWGSDDDDDDDDVSGRGSTMGPGMMGYGRGGTMGPGMMGYGRGGMMGPGMVGPGYAGPGAMHRGRLTEEQLDFMSERMAENYERMRQLAGTTDKEKRRELMRELYQSMHRYRGGMY